MRFYCVCVDLSQDRHSKTVKRDWEANSDEDVRPQKKRPKKSILVSDDEEEEEVAQKSTGQYESWTRRTVLRYSSNYGVGIVWVSYKNIFHLIMLQKKSTMRKWLKRVRVSMKAGL